MYALSLKRTRLLCLPPPLPTGASWSRWSGRRVRAHRGIDKVVDLLRCGSSSRIVLCIPLRRSSRCR